ncbi:MAG: hypothetical protein PUB21_11270 [Bacteroidales bacterium]|nr:hypothetical protein [Bacteroidales bacterium]
MPIDLFENIIMPHITPCSGIRMVEPAGNLKEYIENFYIFPYRYNLKSYLAFNDGFPMAAIMVGEEGIHNLNDYKYGISSAWFSAKINGNRRIYISKEFSYLLIIRFKKIPFYRLFGLNPKKFNNRPFWSFSDILGDDGTELLKIISLCSTEKEKIRAIESFI